MNLNNSVLFKERDAEMDKSWREIDFKSIKIDLKSLYRVPKKWLKCRIEVEEAEKNTW
jgi:hypothetical protein